MSRLTPAANRAYPSTVAAPQRPGLQSLSKAAKSRCAVAGGFFHGLVRPSMGGRAGGAARLAGALPVLQLPFGRPPDCSRVGGSKPQLRHTTMTTTDLVPVFPGTLAGQSTTLCNARDLHAALEVGRDFTTWIKERIAEYGFVSGEDFSPVLGKTSARGGRPATDYHLTLDTAKELSMVENNDIGRRIRRYLIALEKKQTGALPAPAISAAPVPLLPAPDPITANLRQRIAKKAHALALDQYDTLQDLLEELVVSNLKCGATESACEEYLERFGSGMGGVTLVNTHDLYQLARQTTALLDKAGEALAIIHRLEKHTGMNLYHRKGVSGLPDSLCKTVFNAIQRRQFAAREKGK